MDNSALTLLYFPQSLCKNIFFFFNLMIKNQIALIIKGRIYSGSNRSEVALGRRMIKVTFVIVIDICSAFGLSMKLRISQEKKNVL